MCSAADSRGDALLPSCWSISSHFSAQVTTFLVPSVALVGSFFGLVEANLSIVEGNL